MCFGFLDFLQFQVLGFELQFINKSLNEIIFFSLKKKVKNRSEIKRCSKASRSTFVAWRRNQSKMLMRIWTTPSKW